MSTAPLNLYRRGRASRRFRWYLGSFNHLFYTSVWSVPARWCTSGNRPRSPSPRGPARIYANPGSYAPRTVGLRPIRAACTPCSRSGFPARSPRGPSVCVPPCRRKCKKKNHTQAFRQSWTEITRLKN